MSFKTEISDIVINGSNYKYYHNKYDNIHYLTSTEQSQELLDFINIFLSSLTDINWNIIEDIVKNYKPINNINNIIIEDKYNIFNVNIKYKYNIDDKLLLSNFLTKYQSIRQKPSNIPQELFINNKQLANMVLNEINKVNTNLNYSHYIVCNNDDLMDLSFRFVYNKQLGEIMEQFNKQHNYNYFEINIKLSELHPYLPPIISYSKPRVDIKLISAIYSLDIWKSSSWNYLISLDWLINNLADALEEHFIKYIDPNDTKIDFIELKMLELNKQENNSDIIIDLKFNKIHNSDNNKGVGYGNKNTNWDISQFIDITKTQDEYTISILNQIIEYINSNNILRIIIPDSFNKFIINKFYNINLLVFNNKIDLYKTLLNAFNIINNVDDIKLFLDYSKDIIEEIELIVSNQDITIEENMLCVYLYYTYLFEKNKNIASTLNIKTEASDIKDKYLQMVKENNYNIMNIDASHRFYIERMNKITPKTIMRIMSELSSLKKDLPINWDSSIVMRISKTNTNLISFIIVGPKDTPYHNGLFEFHAYFPDNYPSVVPKVLINTTDNSRVRFNPNLYNNGKVCLSLLGTWQGEKGESWIPEISTFFQVLISIQSLILVDEPYFNEPGYEKTMNTPDGKKHSSLYNDNIRYETVKVAMIGMLKNKVKHYEDFIEQHFKLKKDEIIQVVDKWYQESINKEKFKKVYDELLNLL